MRKKMLTRTSWIIVISLTVLTALLTIYRVYILS